MYWINDNDKNLYLGNGSPGNNVGEWERKERVGIFNDPRPFVTSLLRRPARHRIHLRFAAVPIVHHSCYLFSSSLIHRRHRRSYMIRCRYTRPFFHKNPPGAGIGYNFLLFYAVSSKYSLCSSSLLIMSWNLPHENYVL